MKINIRNIVCGIVVTLIIGATILVGDYAFPAEPRLPEAGCQPACVKVYVSENQMSAMEYLDLNCDGTPDIVVIWVIGMSGPEQVSTIDIKSGDNLIKRYEATGRKGHWEECK